MTMRVISGPAPIVTPADVPGDHSDTDANVTRMIASAQATIDGPTGWVGRAFGKQFIELWLPWFPCEDLLLMGPVIGSISVKYLDRDEVEQTVDAGLYRNAGNILLFKRAFRAPSTACAPDAVRIQWEAGYEDDAMPAQAQEAVILMALHAKAVGAENLFLRSEEVEGVGTLQYTVSDQAGAAVVKAVENLMDGLRIYR